MSQVDKDRIINAFKNAVVNVKPEGNSFIVDISINKLFNSLSDDLEVIRSTLDGGKIVVYASLKDIKVLGVDFIESAVAKVTLKPDIVTTLKKLSGLDVGDPVQVSDDIIIPVKLTNVNPIKPKEDF